MGTRQELGPVSQKGRSRDLEGGKNKGNINGLTLSKSNPKACVTQQEGAACPSSLQSLPRGQLLTPLHGAADQTTHQERLRPPCSWAGPRCFIKLPGSLFSSSQPSPLSSGYTSVSHSQYQRGHGNDRAFSGSCLQLLKA